MPKVETTPTRAPRGTKPVSQAFFAALAAIPEAARSAVARAALVMIRDELKTQREKAKTTAAKAKTRKQPATKRAVKPDEPRTEASALLATPSKRRPRKPADAPATS